MFIQKEDLIIRSAEPEDAAILKKWWSDGKIMEHAGFPLGIEVDEKRLRNGLSNKKDNSDTLIIEVEQKPIGEMSFENIGNNTAEIGIKICDFSMQGKGYGSQLIMMLIHELFMNGGFEKLILDTNLNNERAQHVYEKLGFHKVGVRIDDSVDQIGRVQSFVDYEMSKENYIRNKKS